MSPSLRMQSPPAQQCDESLRQPTLIAHHITLVVVNSAHSRLRLASSRSIIGMPRQRRAERKGQNLNTPPSTALEPEMSSTSHKALFLTSERGTFELGTQPTPIPGPGELLVRIEAAALNPLEWKLKEWGTTIGLPRGYPAILGVDVAGIVVQLGEGVEGFEKGDRTVYQGWWSNDKTGFQQYGLVDARYAAKVPSNISLEEAASIPCALVAAIAGLYVPKPHGAGLTLPLSPSTRGKNAGQPILVLGGASSLGQAAIQFARLSGCSPILTTASLKNTDFLTSLGATHVLDRTLSFPALQSQISQIIQEKGKPLGVVYDAISEPETQQAGYDLLADGAGGHLVLVLPEQITRKGGEGKKNVTVGMIYGHWEHPRLSEVGVEVHRALTGLLQEGLFKPNRVEVLPGGLRGIAGGLERLKEGKVSGTKLVVRPQETE
ncbi:putative groES-like protein [Lyophyllum shimeji]|uniref:GroES-like protein n=1 Tax=Lyophyllum shimeji TaxID=47721 RepID=A0A9P3PSG7_LYOSH|nr:putative groES-like protein [Lyophyllum shimeji]